MEPVAGVWLALVDLDAPGEDAAARRALLSPAERARADRLVRPEVRRRFVAARAALREALGRWVGAPPASLELLQGPHGKPALPSGPRFNLSHAGGLALIAISAEREVGVDLEAIRAVPEADAIAAEWFDAAERRALEGSPPDRRDEAFLRLWVRREACLKAIGVGLSDPGAAAARRCAVHDLAPAPGHVGALALAP